MEDWKLVEVEDNDEYTDDQSGVYVLVSVRHDRRYRCVRADVMRIADSEPLRSFHGPANAVRKAVVEYIESWGYEESELETFHLSPQHASYIGQEIQRAALQGEEYVQD